MKLKVTSFLLVLVMVMCSSCGAVETIFKAGMWWAFILIGLAVVLILWIIGKSRK